jgi:hypothetical protein
VGRPGGWGSAVEREKMGGRMRGRRAGPARGETHWQGEEGEDADPWARWV